LDDEQELLADVAKDMARHSVAATLRASRSQPSPPRYTSKEKGKGRAILRHVEDDGVEDEEEEGEDDGEAQHKGARYTPGPLSEEGRNEALQLGKQTTDAFMVLAKKYGKSPQTMMVASGLAIQNACQGQNFSNKFKQWYSVTYPARPGGKCLFTLSSPTSLSDFSSVV
jgi:hypothetical protein